MTNTKEQKNQYTKKINGTIDYQYYENRARTLRSEFIWSLLKEIFTTEIAVKLWSLKRSCRINKSKRKCPGDG